jgi:hypothetical protein
MSKIKNNVKTKCFEIEYGKIITKRVITMKSYQSSIFLEVKDLVIKSMIENPKEWTLVKENEISSDYVVHETGVRVYVYYGTVSIDGKTFSPLDQGDMEEIAAVAGQMVNKNKIFMATRETILGIKKRLSEYQH